MRVLWIMSCVCSLIILNSAEELLCHNKLEMWQEALPALKRIKLRFFFKKSRCCWNVERVWALQQYFCNLCSFSLTYLFSFLDFLPHNFFYDPFPTLLSLFPLLNTFCLWRSTLIAASQVANLRILNLGALLEGITCVFVFGQRMSVGDFVDWLIGSYKWLNNYRNIWKSKRPVCCTFPNCKWRSKVRYNVINFS